MNFSFLRATLLLSYLGLTLGSAFAGQASVNFDRRASSAVQCLSIELANVVSLPQAVDDLRESYIRENIETQFSSSEENKFWIRIADETQPGGTTRFLDAENTFMKILNDSIRDKNLVTALTHRYKSLLLQKLGQIQTENPGIQIVHYNDFKSLRFAFRGKIFPELKTQIDLGFQAANRQFVDELRTNRIVRMEDIRDTWFRAGYGDTADRASIAARAARESAGPNRLVSFEESWIQERLKKTLLGIESNRKAIESDFENLLPFDGLPGKKTPALEIFELIRKSKDPMSLFRSLKTRYPGRSFTFQQTQKLFDYSVQLDLFSPSLRIIKREVVNLDEADFGGFSADFLGMGASNSASIASALAGEKNLNRAIFSSRKAEAEVTARFQAQLASFREVAGDSTGCSGDDCSGVFAHVWTRAEKIELISRVASDLRTRRVRMAFIEEGISKKDRTMISTHGEAIEKALRKNLEGLMTPARLNEITFGIDMLTKKVRKGSVDALIGTDPTRPLSAREIQQIQIALRDAVYEVNREITRTGLMSRYRPVFRIKSF